MGRQAGAVLGVAGLVAVLAHVSPTNPLAAFRHGLWLIIAFFLAAALTAASTLIRRTATPRPILLNASARRPPSRPRGARRLGKPGPSRVTCDPAK